MNETIEQYKLCIFGCYWTALSFSRYVLYMYAFPYCSGKKLPLNRCVRNPFLEAAKEKLKPPRDDSSVKIKPKGLIKLHRHLQFPPSRV